MVTNKELILDSARDIFLKSGIANLSMRKVAQKVGISATAIYRHYKNKEELLLFVFLRGYQLFKQYLTSVDEQQDPMECLHQTIMAYLEFALKEQAYYRTLFMSGDEVVDIKNNFPEHIQTLTENFLILQNRVESLNKNSVSKESSYEIAFSIWAYAHGQISLFLQQRTGLEINEFSALYQNNMSKFLNNIDY